MPKTQAHLNTDEDDGKKLKLKPAATVTKFHDGFPKGLTAGQKVSLNDEAFNRYPMFHGKKNEWTVMKMFGSAGNGIILKWSVDKSEYLFSYLQILGVKG